MATTLYVHPGSHPSMAARLMLERKGIDYRRRDLMPAIHKLVLRAQGFPGATAPALRIDDRKVQGSRQIARELDRVKPDPPLFPSDPGRRTEVEDAERWGDEVLQPKPRRLSWWAFKRDRSPLASYSQGYRLGVPIGLAVKTAAPIVWLAARYNDATDERVRADLASLPGDLNRIDRWISDGVLGGDEPNAADYQIATSLRLLITMDDVRPAIEGRSAGELAMRLVPAFPGRLPPIFPPAWLEGLRR